MDENLHRRLLSKEESMNLHTKLKQRWGVSGYWYPLKTPVPKDLDIICLVDECFEPYITKLQNALLALNVTKIYELREYGDEYEIETKFFEPYYSGAEGYWFDKKMEWLIYVSHENSITFAGSLIVKLIKDIFPNYKSCLWGEYYP